MLANILLREKCEYGPARVPLGATEAKQGSSREKDSGKLHLEEAGGSRLLQDDLLTSHAPWSHDTSK